MQKINHVTELPELGAVTANELAESILRLPKADIDRLMSALAAVGSTELPVVLKHGNNYTHGGDINVYGLTGREIEVLILLARGYTRKEIGATLKISQNTAATHVASLYRKLDIGTIAEATHIAIRCALVRLM